MASFVFLLLGLASLSSSINLLVLKSMILSLEDNDEEFDLQDVTQNVITVDDEYINGSTALTARRLGLLRPPETVSVCSCTCYPGSSNSREKRKTRIVTQTKSKLWCWQRLWQKWTRGSARSVDTEDHFFDAETMSISNAKKYAIKRNSM